MRATCWAGGPAECGLATSSGGGLVNALPDPGVQDNRQPAIEMQELAGERKIMSGTKAINKNISIVGNKKYKYLTKADPQICKCDEQPCQTRVMTEWTPCSRTCGKGMQNRQVACTQVLSSGTLIRAPERDCMTAWEAGVWSER